jgi:UDP-N-acetylglucosamine 2-epimerase (non-hydrolysing)
MQNILIIFGTRPEAIKFAPLIKAIETSEFFNPIVCSTGQHKEMLAQVLDFFSIEVDYDLALMTKNQSLLELTSNAILKIKTIIDTTNPNLIFVQGDTTTAFVGALAGFYSKIPVAHLEAGLRSFDLTSPFPEEGNRKLIGNVATYHFTPTNNASNNLIQEKIISNICEVGNTVIDALLLTLDIIKDKGLSNQFKEKHQYLNQFEKSILITAHRRESFGAPFEELCDSIKTLAINYPKICFTFPVHLNPIVQEIVYRTLDQIDNIKLIAPLDYPELIWMMNQSYLIITDSGGIQEEAPSLGKPIIVIREVTERTEGIDAGTAILTGTNKNKIINTFDSLIDNSILYNKMSKSKNPYGKGDTSEAIINILETKLIKDN